MTWFLLHDLFLLVSTSIGKRERRDIRSGTMEGFPCLRSKEEREKQIMSTQAFTSYTAKQSPGLPLCPKCFRLFLKPLCFYAKVRKIDNVQMVKQNCLSSQKNSFSSSNNTNKQQGPEEKTCKSLFIAKHLCQDHLDPHRISFGIPRLMFKKVIFGNSQGTEDNTDKFIGYYIDLRFFIFCNIKPQKSLLKLSGTVWLLPYWGYQI